MNLFQQGNFTLHSGKQSGFRIECDALSDDDIAAIAKELAQRLPPFGEVRGVPRGGLRLAAYMGEYSSEGPPLIVDDVLTTGGSMNEVRRAWFGNERLVLGAVIFARTLAYPFWVTPLFVMTDQPQC